MSDTDWIARWYQPVCHRHSLVNVINMNDQTWDNNQLDAEAMPKFWFGDDDWGGIVTFAEMMILVYRSSNYVLQWECFPFLGLKSFLK